jgi:hypothetical protein
MNMPLKSEESKRSQTDKTNIMTVFSLELELTMKHVCIHTESAKWNRRKHNRENHETKIRLKSRGFEKSRRVGTERKKNARRAVTLGESYFAVRTVLPSVLRCLLKVSADIHFICSFSISISISFLALSFAFFICRCFPSLSLPLAIVFFLFQLPSLLCGSFLC